MSEEDLAYFAGPIVSGQYTAARTAELILTSDEMKARNLSNEEFIRVLYGLYLDRDADPEGLAAWAEKLNAGEDRLDIIRGFAAAEEFRGILGRFGLK